MPEQHYSPEQAANLLSLSPRYVRRLLRFGKLRGSKIGRVWSVPESALDDLLREGQNIKTEGETRGSTGATEPPEHQRKEP
jgi:excisionase family DNA binding protein